MLSGRKRKSRLLKAVEDLLGEINVPPKA